MKQKTLFLLLLLGIAHFASANRFYLSVQRVFSENEEVRVRYQDRYYYNRSKTNGKSISLRLFEVKDVQAYINEPSANNYYQLYPDSLLQQLRSVKSWEKTIENKRSSIHLNLGKLPSGFYLLEGIMDGHVTQIPIVVSNYSLVTKSTADEMLCYMSNSETGEAVRGFEAVALTTNTKQKIPATKYVNGLAYFTKGSTLAGQPVVFATKGDKIAISKAYFYSYYYYNTRQGGLTSYLFTDRSAYRPDQKVYMKGILRMKEKLGYSIPADSITYRITGPKGTEVAKKHIVLDGMGGFSDSLQLTSDMKLGEYKIQTKLKTPHGAFDWREQYTFLVEEYKKPEYEVVVSLDKSQYVLGDSMNIDVEAKYFFGAPVANATVSYRIIREQYYVPYWRSWAYWWWYEDYYSNYTRNREVVKYGTGEIGEDGKFSVEIPTKTGKGKNNQNYRYTIQADVRDASRRTITGSAKAMVAYTEYTVTAYSEKYYYELDDSASIVVSTADLSGSPITADLAVKVQRQYWKNNDWSKNEEEASTITTDPKTGKAVFRFKPTKSGYYYVSFTGKDKRGREVTSTTNVYVLKEGDYAYNWWNNNSENIQIITDKKVYKAGETVKAMIVTRHQADGLVTVGNRHLHYYNIHQFKGKKIPEKGATQGGMEQIEFNFDPNISGKVALMVNYVKGGKLFQKTAYITLIPSHKYIDVSITFDRKDYRPRSFAEATIKVTDQNGRPVPNAQVVLSTADESIYSLYPDKTADIRKVFYKMEEVHSNSNKAYHNQYSAYKHSRGLTPIEILDRMKRYDQVFTRSTFLSSKEWYNLQKRGAAEGRIRGFVLDKETGKPLAGVKIKVKGKAFTTNQYGFYSIKGFEFDYVDMMFEHEKGKAVVKRVRTSKSQGILLNIEISKGIHAHNFHPTLSAKNIQLWRRKGKALASTSDSLAMPELLEIDDEEEVEMDIAAEDYDEVVEAPATEQRFMAMSSSGLASKRKVFSRNSNTPTYKAATVRKDFQDAIYWNPTVVTNSLGMAKVTIRLPDNLTTWRTTARVVTQDTKVGQSIAKIIVRKNLLVRMETPRFMTVGDELLIATNIHNYLSTSKQVKVSLQANGVAVTGSAQTITVAANGEQRIDWKVDANWAVKAKLTVQALTDEESDAKEVKVPVNPYGLEMVAANATYLQNESKDGFTVNIPKGTDLNTVNLELSANASITSALLGAMDDLIGYPYGCVEQTMSRFLPNVLVANTLQELGGKYQSNISQEELLKMVNQGLKRLGQLQQRDGGWGWWQNDGPSAYYTSYVTNGLYLAKKAGYQVNDQMYQKAITALTRQIVSYQSRTKEKKKTSVLYAFQMMVAMQCELKPLWKKKLYIAKEVTNSYEAALWLQAAHLVKDEQVMKEMQTWLEDHVQKEGGRYFWGGQRFYYRWQQDQVETTANVVRALAMINPDHKLLPGAAQWLLMKRKGKSWHNTRQTAMTIYGLNELIKKEFNPDMQVEIYVNDTKIDDLIFVAGSKGYTYQIKGTSFTVSLGAFATSSKYNLLREGDNEIRVVQKGKGTSYINTKLTYFLDGESQRKDRKGDEKPFTVIRTYYKLVRKFSKTGVLTYKKVPIAQSEIKSGDDIFVKTKVVSNVERDHILIEDPIPAGCEFVRDTKGYIIEGEKQYTGKFNYYGYRGYWNRWYTHQEFRDAKFSMTITRLYQGTYEYSYIMKAQIPGKFKITPAVSQLMYYPEIRGFSKFSELEIKE